MADMKEKTIRLDDIRSRKGNKYGQNDDAVSRKKKFPFRTALAALTLFGMGSLLIFAAYRIGMDEERRGLSFFILGLICFIPGSYATVQLYGAYQGWRGYSYDQIPSYDD